jgi:hypothetical protein
MASASEARENPACSTSAKRRRKEMIKFVITFIIGFLIGYFADDIFPDWED